MRSFIAMTRKTSAGPQPAAQPDLPDWFNKDLAIESLRFAQEFCGAPSRCRRRSCASGHCHLTMSQKSPANCGAGMDGPAALLGAVLFTFATRGLAGDDTPFWADVDAPQEDRDAMAGEVRGAVLAGGEMPVSSAARKP